MGKKNKKEQRMKRRAKSQGRLRTVQPSYGGTIHFEEGALFYEVETETVLELLGITDRELVLSAANRLFAVPKREWLNRVFNKDLIAVKMMDDEQLDPILHRLSALSANIIDRWEENQFLYAKANHLKYEALPIVGHQYGQEITKPLDDQIYYIEDVWTDDAGLDWARIWDSARDETITVQASELGYCFKPAQPQGENHYEDNQTAH
jgi:hypothetical protein